MQDSNLESQYNFWIYNTFNVRQTEFELDLKTFWETNPKTVEPLFETKQNEYVCGYRKGKSTQYPLLNLIESWKRYRDNHGFSAAVLMDLSKAFDIINHDVLLAELHAYGFSTNALKHMMSYL